MIFQSFFYSIFKIIIVKKNKWNNNKKYALFLNYLSNRFLALIIVLIYHLKLFIMLKLPYIGY
jgi:hypothetical protein